MNTKPLLLALIALLTAACAADGQGFTPNYDEANVPQYTLPDPLAGISSADQWPARRDQILQMFASEMYGKVPPQAPAEITVKHRGTRKTVLDGKAIMWQPVLQLAGRDLHLLVFLPVEAKQAVPAFLLYNFGGNHTVFADADIPVTEHWVRKPSDHRATDEDRGASADAYSVQRVIDGGFALVTLYYGDVDPDFDDGFQNGVHAALDQLPAADQWGSIATWAWGLSRVLDYFETAPEIDASRVAVMGHSRLGKTSLWAGASDPRFALVISNNSGCGGAALSRRQFGETVWRINTSFPHWFCDNFLKYNNNEDALPFDQHMLLALIAPRPLYVASAQEDQWADPRGEFLSALHASPVYRLLGTEGLPAERMPAVDMPVQGQIGYHVRSGGHAVTDYDWQQYIAFANKHLAP